MSGRMFYVYVDYTMENHPRPFYVGRGVETRLKSLCRNNKHTWVKNTLGIQRKAIIRSSDEQETLVYETVLIAALDTFNPDHRDHTDIRCNKTTGGEGTVGVKRSERTRALSSYAHKKSGSLPAYREKIAAIMRAKWANPAYRQRMVEAARNKPPMSDETKLRVGAKSIEMHQRLGHRVVAAMPDVKPLCRPIDELVAKHADHIASYEAGLAARTRVSSEEERARRSIAAKAMWQRPGVREKARLQRLALSQDLKFKEKMRQVVLEQNAKDPELRAKRCAALEKFKASGQHSMKGKHPSEETRRKMSEAHRRRFNKKLEGSENEPV